MIGAIIVLSALLICSLLANYYLLDVCEKLDQRSEDLWEEVERVKVQQDIEAMDIMDWEG